VWVGTSPPLARLVIARCGKTLAVLVLFEKGKILREVRGRWIGASAQQISGSGTGEDDWGERIKGKGAVGPGSGSLVEGCRAKPQTP